MQGRIWNFHPEAGRSTPPGHESRQDAMYRLTNLTRNQFLIWTGHQVSSNLAIYNEVVAFAIEGAVDHRHFERAFRAVVQGTDSLRTVFHEVDGLPVSQVLDQLPYTPAYMDLSDKADPQATLDGWIAAQAVLPLDITSRCFNAALFKLADNRFIWYLLQHHINTDATSILILFKRVADCYARSVAGDLDDLDAYPRFVDYVAFERQRRETARYAKSQAYWAGKLANLSDPVVPGRGSPRATSSTRVPERIRLDLGKDLSDRIRMLAGRDISARFLRTSPSSASSPPCCLRISTASAAASASRSGCRGRTVRKRFSDTVGLLMEQDPFHATIGQEESFESLIRKVQSEALEVMRHLPYAAGNPGGKAYTVVLNYLKSSIGTFAGMPVKPFWPHSGTDDGSMIVNVHDMDGSGFSLDFDFDGETFHPDLRRPVVGHFMNLLEACAGDPAAAIGAARMLAEQEREQLTVTWNDTAAPYRQGVCLPQLIEEQVKRSPDAIALICGNRRLSYHAMNARANVLAHRSSIAGHQGG